MSGGVDSSVAAYLLQENGYEVVGVTMKLLPETELYESGEEYQAIEDARKVAKDLGIEHRVADFSEEFEREIIEEFVCEYRAGRTPNPCARCNPKIKFGKLLELADALGVEYVATGHYARVDIDESSGKATLKRGADPRKDQTYFLYDVPEKTLRRVLFPLGDYTKEEVRSLAEERGVRTYAKKDSEEICFVRHMSHGGFIGRRNPEGIVPGDFVDDKGQVLGVHKGIVHYTIGQRKNLGIALGKRAFVCKIDVAANTVCLSDDAALWHDCIEVDKINSIVEGDAWGSEVSVKIRHGVKEEKARLERRGEKIIVRFAFPVRAPAPGQAAVFYDGETVLGGGTISGVLSGKRNDGAEN